VSREVLSVSREGQGDIFWDFRHKYKISSLSLSLSLLSTFIQREKSLFS